MSPEEAQQLRQEVENLKRVVNAFVRPDRYLFQRNVELFNGQNIVSGTLTGTMFGTASTQKIAFLGKTPVAQQASIADPSGGVTQDSEARTAINAILDVLDIFGFTA